DELIRWGKSEHATVLVVESATTDRENYGALARIRTVIRDNNLQARPLLVLNRYDMLGDDRPLSQHTGLDTFVLRCPISPESRLQVNFPREIQHCNDQDVRKARQDAPQGTQFGLLALRERLKLYYRRNATIALQQAKITLSQLLDLATDPALPDAVRR